MSEQLALGFGPRDEFNAAGFVASPCNADARAALENWQAWPGHALALIGPAGSGKTHLARIWQDRTGAVLIDSRRIGEVLDALDTETPVVVENADRAMDEDGLFHLINRAGQDTLPGLLLTGRAAPASWTVNTPDLRSRLAAMPVAELTEPDDALLRQVLQKLFRDRQSPVTPGLIDYLLPRMERSIDSARRLVATLDLVALGRRTPVTRAVVRQVLKDLSETGESDSLDE